MFLCKPCTEKTEGTGHFEEHASWPFSLSQGRCERCHNSANCVDCKCYRLPDKAKNQYPGKGPLV